MAKVSFSALIEEITGKLAGSVFQDSYGGFQIRTRVSPRNPQTNYQQLRRGEFGYISALWRTLTSVQRQTFIDAATTEPEALKLFIQSNVNLSLIDMPIIDTYTQQTAPDAMPMQINDLNPESFQVSASGAVTTVPADTKLLLYATTDKYPTRIFTNPSEFSPILSWDEGTDLSVLTDVINEWNDRYGVMRINRRICIKQRLINKINGLSGPESIICAVSEAMAKFLRLYSNITPASSSGPGTTDIYTTTIPANTMSQDGDVVYSVIWGVGSGVSGLGTITFRLNNANCGAYGDTSNSAFLFIARVIRISANSVNIVISGGKNGSNHVVVRSSAGSLDFTTAIHIGWRLQVLVAGTLTADANYINKELV